jgi:uncharacterized SAM-dependent methyltransferase
LGAGDGKKTQVLLKHFSERGVDITYIAIDINETAMKNLINQFTKDPIDITINGIVAEYSEGLKWLSQKDKEQNLILFLGSNIENAHKNEARAFLHKLWSTLDPGDYLLIAFDLKKDIDTLNKAYNDSEKITAQFHLNLLRRINRELGGNFNSDQFKYKDSDVTKLAEETGFEIVQNYTDSKKYFLDSLWRMKKDATDHPL